MQQPEELTYKHHETDYALRTEANDQREAAYSAKINSRRQPSFNAYGDARKPY